LNASKIESSITPIGTTKRMEPLTAVIAVQPPANAASTLDVAMPVYANKITIIDGRGNW
jgi:hypothetical protein